MNTEPTATAVIETKITRSIQEVYMFSTDKEIV